MVGRPGSIEQDTAVTTAFVLSGGASHGAVQVGMLQALAERKVHPDLVFGASAGALNAAWVAGDPRLEHLDGLVGVWTSLRARDVFPLRPLTGLLGFLGRRDSLVSAAGLRAVVSRNLRFERLEDAPIPLCVVATEVTSGREVALDHRRRARRDHRQRHRYRGVPAGRRRRTTLMDGGVVNNTPISNAIDAGATRIYVLPTGYACDLQHVPRSAIGMTLAGDLPAGTATAHHRRARAAGPGRSARAPAAVPAQHLAGRLLARRGADRPGPARAQDAGSIPSTWAATAAPTSASTSTRTGDAIR